MDIQGLGERLLAARRLIEDCLAELAAVRASESEGPCRHPPDQRKSVAADMAEFYCGACRQIVRREEDE